MEFENPKKLFKPIVEVDKETGLPKKDPEEKMYLVWTTDTYGEEKHWFMGIGRTNTYDALKLVIMNNDNIDVRMSYVLVEGKRLGSEITVYDFMKHMENFFPNPKDGFDIEDYDTGDFDTQDDDEESYKVDDKHETQLDVTMGSLNEADSEDI